MFSLSFRKCAIYCTYLSHTDYFYGALVFFWSLKGLCECKIEISALFKMCLFVHVPQRKWNPTDLEQHKGEDIKIVNNHFWVNWSFNRNTVRKTNCSLLIVVIFSFVHFSFDPFFNLPLSHQSMTIDMGCIPSVCSALFVYGLSITWCLWLCFILTMRCITTALEDALVKGRPAAVPMLTAVSRWRSLYRQMS